MLKKLLVLITLSWFSLGSQAAPIDSLKDQINAVLKNKDATVGVAVLAGDSSESLSINGDRHLPMQSVFKYHLALAVLDQVDNGNLSLSDKIQITPKELDNKLWSPIRKEYPNGALLTLAEILTFTLAYSDNVGCDLLFKIVGGPKVVEEYLHMNGITDIAIEYDEVSQQALWSRQYENWTTAIAANMALKIAYENEGALLSPESHYFLWETMKASKTGKKTIKGNLPKEALVAHKTGSSGKNDAGLTGAQNDIGIVFLPNGKHFYLSVLVSDSSETHAVNKKIIADIAKLTWDYYQDS